MRRSLAAIAAAVIAAGRAKNRRVEITIAKS
jgi:flagellar motor protein MotB